VPGDHAIEFLFDQPGTFFQIDFDIERLGGGALFGFGL
jgi:hypothetical protein